MKLEPRACPDLKAATASERKGDQDMDMHMMERKKSHFWLGSRTIKTLTIQNEEEGTQRLRNT